LLSRKAGRQTEFGYCLHRRLVFGRAALEHPA
jgi:hypothetical protein